jgi:hypothetical protein
VSVLTTVILVTDGVGVGGEVAHRAVLRVAHLEAAEFAAAVREDVARGDADVGVAGGLFAGVPEVDRPEDVHRAADDRIGMLVAVREDGGLEVGGERWAEPGRRPELRIGAGKNSTHPRTVVEQNSDRGKRSTGAGQGLFHGRIAFRAGVVFVWCPAIIANGQNRLGNRLPTREIASKSTLAMIAGHHPFLGRLWCFVRQHVRVASGRQRYNVLGALDAVMHVLVAEINATSINSLSACALLRKVAALSVGVPISSR